MKRLHTVTLGHNFAAIRTIHSILLCATLLTLCLVVCPPGAQAGISFTADSHEISPPDVWDSVNNQWIVNYNRALRLIRYDQYGDRYGFVAWAGQRELFFRVLDTNGSPITSEVSVTPRGDYPTMYDLNWTDYGYALATYDDDYGYVGPYPQDVMIKTIYGYYGTPPEHNLTGEDAGVPAGYFCGEAETNAKTSFNPITNQFLTIYTQHQTTTRPCGGSTCCEGWNNPQLHGQLHYAPPSPHPVTRNYGNIGSAFANVYNSVTNEFVLGLFGSSTGMLKVQRINSSGGTIGSSVTVTPADGVRRYYPQLTVVPDASGDMVLMWGEYMTMTDCNGNANRSTLQIFAQMLDGQGTPIGSPVTVVPVEHGMYVNNFSFDVLSDAILVTTVVNREKMNYYESSYATCTSETEVHAYLFDLATFNLLDGPVRVDDAVDMWGNPIQLSYDDRLVVTANQNKGAFGVAFSGYGNVYFREVGYTPDPEIHSIPSDTSIGTWDNVNRVFTLTTDVSKTIQIDEDNLTLDGAGFTVTGTGIRKGVHVPSGRTGVIITNLTIDGFDTGIYIDTNSANIELIGNTVSNSEFGIILLQSTNNILADNILSSSYGIGVVDSTSNLITGNAMSGQGYQDVGIYLLRSSGNTLTENNTSNVGPGIKLIDSHNNVLKGNIVLGIAWQSRGFSLYTSSNNTLAGNTLSGNYYGMRLLSSSNDNTIAGNTISNNRYGVSIEGSSNNSTYNNNFIDNTQYGLFYQANVSGSNNVFQLDKPFGGNYWNDHTNTDSDGDGFADVVPYSFSGGQDDLPWANMVQGWEADNTPAGQNISVDLGPVTVTFDDVTEPGTTTITVVAPPDGNFYIDFIPLFYDITTTATFTGNVHIEINYDESAITPPALETDLRLFKFTGTPPAPIDITDGSISPNPNITANMIYGVTDGFSIFAVGILPNQPPVADAGDDDTVPADALCEAHVSLDGGGSYDPDGTIEGYTWTGPFGEVLGVNPTVTLGLGENTITLTVSDGELTGTDEVVVTIEDTTPPTIALPADVTLDCPADTDPLAVGQATASDACGEVILTYSDTEVTGCGDTRTITRTWTAEDPSGNITSAVQTITVVDDTAPVITAPPVTLECGSDTSTAATGIASVADTCGGTILSYSDSFTADCGNTEVITRTWEAEDACGNTATVDQIITIKDTTEPSLTIPADVTLEYPADTTPGSTGTATADDACGTVTISFQDATVPGCGNTEILTRTWTAKDACGNTTTGVQTITVVDTTAPELTVPADVTVEADGELTGVDSGQATATDAVGPVTVSSDPPVPGQFPLGTTEVTWTATDGAGNQTTGTQLVTVADTTAPELTVPAEVTVEAEGELTVVDSGQATAADAVGPVTVTSDAPAEFPLGTTTVTWTATDGAGNQTTGTQLVTVVDTTAPVLEVPADVTVEAEGELTGVDIDQAAAADAVGPVTIASDAPALFPLGTTVVTWTATDGAGNQTTGTQLVTVADTTAPELTVPADVTVEAEGELTGVDSGQATATDAVGAVTVSSDPPVPGQFPLGSTVVTWTATDGAGNQTTGTQSVTVADTTAPELAVPADLTVEADGPLTAVDIGQATAADAVGPVTVTNDAPALFPLGTTTVTWTATDGAGNQTTGTQLVTVVDTEPPAITNPTGNTTGTTGDPVTITATLGDNVGLSWATLYYRPINAVGYTVLDFSAGSAVVPVANNAAGQILYYILARDSAGNEGRAPGTGTYTITVSDDEAPVALGDSYGAVEDTPLTVSAPGVLANDTDNISSVTLTAVLAGNAAHGAVVLNPDGSFTYNPAANFNGTDTFTYRANDGFADSAPATVTISVAAVNDLPVLGAIGDQTVDEGETLNLQVAATDPDGTTPALSATDLPANATFVDNGDGTGTFTWEIGFEDAGVYSISFIASDGTLSDTRTMTLTVNDLPSFRLVSPSSGVELPYKPPATFVWEGGDYKKFYVQFSRFSNFPRHRTLTLPVKRKKKQSVTSLTPRRGAWAIIRLMEKRGGIIYWRVKARGKKGFRDYTDDWSFSIEDPKWISHWKKRWGRYRDNWVDRDD